MDELVERLVSKLGIGREQAVRAVTIVLAFLKDAGPPDKVGELMARLPGAEEVDTASAGSFRGMMGAMTAFNALTAAGLDMGEIQGVTKQIVAFAKEKTSPELVDEVVGSIPGLGSFV